MQSQFVHKLLLVILAGFFAACLIEFYKTFIKGADEALNGGYRKQEQTVPRSRR